MTLLVTGGAGFIGANLVRHLVARGERVVTLDALTYAGHRASLEGLPADQHRLVVGDIRDAALVAALLREHRPRAVLHLAAESHVDRSIHGPAAFVETNVVGTGTLLQCALDHWRTLPVADQGAFRFLHVSTDEVFGSLAPAAPAFNEDTPYAPNSPYSASKAGADHLVRAWHHTYGLPTLTTHCSNNYGPYQFPEKLIPLSVLHAIEDRPLPLYGDGLNVRDWIHVDDHVRGVLAVLERGRPGACYAIGADSERSNRQVMESVCALLDQWRPQSAPHARLITRVADRPGHDRRYAIDATRMRCELNWAPQESFDSGLRRTVRWYLDHPQWIAAVRGRSAA